MGSGFGRSLFAAGLVLASISFASSARTEADNTFFLRLPASEITKLEADATAGNVDALYLRSLYLAAKDQGGGAEMADLRERAASAGHPAAQSTLCFLQSLAKGEDQSTAYCYRAAHNGDASAQSWLALGLNLGFFGLVEDRASALSFYRQAAFQGQASALAEVGGAYSNGDGVEKDDVLAVHYWERAASLDDASSLRELGRAYALGKGVGQDIDKALNYLSRASDLGDGPAQYYAGLVYRVKSNPFGAYVMFALAVKTLSPGELRDAAMKARSEQQRVLTKTEMQRARPIVSNWKKIDPKPQPFIGGIECGWWGEQTGDMATDDAHSLVYDSAPLAEALEIMGMPQVRLRVAADAPFYQWTVRLEDVAPDGKVSLVSGAIINPSQRFSRLEPAALIPGEPTTLTTSVHFTTWRFKPGHRIRLAVANAQFPMIWPSPTPGATSLLLSNDTWLELPVVPTQNETNQACILPPPEPSDAAPFGKELENSGPVFNSFRNEQTGDSTFTTANDIAWVIRDDKYRSSESYRWDVNDAMPANARYQGERRNIFTIKGNEIDLSTKARIESDASYFHVTFTKILRKNGELIRERTWADHIPRMYQ